MSNRKFAVGDRVQIVSIQGGLPDDLMGKYRIIAEVIDGNDNYHVKGSSYWFRPHNFKFIRSAEQQRASRTKYASNKAFGLMQSRRETAGNPWA